MSGWKMGRCGRDCVSCLCQHPLGSSSPMCAATTSTHARHKRERSATTHQVPVPHLAKDDPPASPAPIEVVARLGVEARVRRGRREVAHDGAHEGPAAGLAPPEGDRVAAQGRSVRGRAKKEEVGGGAGGGKERGALDVRVGICGVHIVSARSLCLRVPSVRDRGRRAHPCPPTASTPRARTRASKHAAKRSRARLDGPGSRLRARGRCREGRRGRPLRSEVGRAASRLCGACVERERLKHEILCGRVGPRILRLGFVVREEARVPSLGSAAAALSSFALVVRRHGGTGRSSSEKSDQAPGVPEGRRASKGESERAWEGRFGAESRSRARRPPDQLTLLAGAHVRRKVLRSVRRPAAATDCNTTSLRRPGRTLATALPSPSPSSPSPPPSPLPRPPLSAQTHASPPHA